MRLRPRRWRDDWPHSGLIYRASPLDDLAKSAQAQPPTDGDADQPATRIAELEQQIAELKRQQAVCRKALDVAREPDEKKR